MNPFDLPGPQFLVFYLLLSVVTIAAASSFRRRAELIPHGGGGAQLHDPYAVAYLRGGKNEMVRVAAVALLDRGLLVTDGETMRTSDVGSATQTRRTVERELLEACRTPRDAEQLFAEHVCAGAAHEYEVELTRMRLLPDDAVDAARLRIFRIAGALLGGVAAIKFAVALLRGRTNVLFLVIFAVVALLVLRRALHPRLTAKGSAHIADLQNLFRSLLGRAAQIRAGGSSTELAMLAAVWGLSVVPATVFPWLPVLFKRAHSGDDGGAGGGSSCGSSCGSGCGGGGGGCGGCGG